jgi:hypothetical protein
VQAERSGVANEEWVNALEAMGKEIISKFDKVAPAISSGGGNHW